MKIQVFGPGCPNCREAADVMRKNALELGLVEGKDFMVEKVVNIKEIVDAGVLLTPGIAINGNIISTGKVLSDEDAQNYIKEYIDKTNG